MADYLQTDYWVGRMVQLYKDNVEVKGAGYKFIAAGDLFFNPAPGDLSASIPCLLVSIPQAVPIQGVDLSAEAEEYTYRLETLSVHTFTDAGRVLTAKSTIASRLHDAVRTVETDGASTWESPTTGHQFLNLEPVSIELRPAEEVELRSREGYQNTHIVKLSYDLMVRSTK